MAAETREALFSAAVQGVQAVPRGGAPYKKFVYVQPKIKQNYKKERPETSPFALFIKF